MFCDPENGEVADRKVFVIITSVKVNDSIKQDSKLILLMPLTVEFRDCHIILFYLIGYWNMSFDT